MLFLKKERIFLSDSNRLNTNIVQYTVYIHSALFSKIRIHVQCSGSQNRGGAYTKLFMSLGSGVSLCADNQLQYIPTHLNVLMMSGVAFAVCTQQTSWNSGQKV